jgi:hypothetical protein
MLIGAAQAAEVSSIAWTLARYEKAHAGTLSENRQSEERQACICRYCCFGHHQFLLVDPYNRGFSPLGIRSLIDTPWRADNSKARPMVAAPEEEKWPER